MPLYVADYLRDTRKLTPAEHGAYLLLIMEYWTSGGLPGDDRQLARVVGMSSAEWRKAKPNVQGFFGNDWKSHKRIDTELAKSAEISSKRSASAKQKHSNSPANAQQEHTHAGATSQPQSPSPSQKDSEPIGSGADAPIDHRKRLFDEGLKTLARLTGKGPDACRSFVGKCLKAASDDAVTVLGLIEDAERNQVVDASAWIAARLKTGPPTSAKPLTEFQRKQAETNDVRTQLRDLADSLGGGGKADRLVPINSGQRPENVRGGASPNLLALPRTFGSGGD